MLARALQSIMGNGAPAAQAVGPREAKQMSDTPHDPSTRPPGTTGSETGSDPTRAAERAQRGRHDRGSGPASGVPLPPDSVTLRPLERETGETGATADHRDEAHTARTPAQAELPVAERRERNMEDNTRHDSSLGNR